MSLSPEAVLATLLAFLAGVGAAIAGIAGVFAAARLRVPTGGDRSSVALSASGARADAAIAALAASGAFVCGGALMDAAIWAAYQSPTAVLFDAGIVVIIAGPIASILAARRSRALTRTAALVMHYELGFPAGLRDHDAAIESALAAETQQERALRRYAAARERALRRARPRAR